MKGLTPQGGWTALVRGREMNSDRVFYYHAVTGVETCVLEEGLKDTSLFWLLFRIRTNE